MEHRFVGFSTKFGLFLVQNIAIRCWSPQEFSTGFCITLDWCLPPIFHFTFTATEVLFTKTEALFTSRRHYCCCYSARSPVCASQQLHILRAHCYRRLLLRASRHSFVSHTLARSRALSTTHLRNDTMQKSSHDLVFADPLKPVKLADFRNVLIRQEETIIFALIERAQFPRNAEVYVKRNQRCADHSCSVAVPVLRYLLSQDTHTRMYGAAWSVVAASRSVVSRASTTRSTAASSYVAY